MTVQPDFIIIGAMKCATTTLHAQLDAQPGISLTDKLDEPDYFSNDEKFSRGPEWYASLFDHAAEDDLMGDASTGYAKLPTHPRTVERIRDALPDPRIIYLMRHPVKRLVSHYAHDWLGGSLNMPIDRAVTDHRPIVDYGLYAMQLRPYLQTFGPQCVLPVFFERFVTESQTELERVCKFIGYQGTPRWVGDVEHTNVSSQRLRRSALRDCVVNFPGVRIVRQRFIPQSIRDRIKRRWSMNKRPQLSADVEAAVHAEFDADLAELGSWLGIELNCANFESAVTSLIPVWTPATPMGS